jgi:hypothetical protein
LVAPADVNRILEDAFSQTVSFDVAVAAPDGVIAGMPRRERS